MTRSSIQLIGESGNAPILCNGDIEQMAEVARKLEAIRGEMTALVSDLACRRLEYRAWLRDIEATGDDYAGMVGLLTSAEDVAAEVCSIMDIAIDAAGAMEDVDRGLARSDAAVEFSLLYGDEEVVPGAAEWVAHRAAS